LFLPFQFQLGSERCHALFSLFTYMLCEC
jgi:hypothetical protein